MNETRGLEFARLGNVNLAAGPRADVLFVNGLKGSGPDRRVVVTDPFALFQVRMKLPPSDADGVARFALHAWVRDARTATVTATPFGRIGQVPELVGGRPKRTWNNTGDPLFGAADLPSVAAPSVVLRRERGIRKRGLFYLQGFIENAASPLGAYAVTNGVLVDSR